MPSCAVTTCSNTHRTKLSPVTNKILHFHKLSSKDDEIKKSWIKACGREVKDKYAVVCSDHFRAEDYERNLKAELLGLPFSPRLKADSVPTLNLTRVSATKIQKVATTRSGGKNKNAGGEDRAASGSVKLGGLVKKEVSIQIPSEANDSDDSNVAAVPTPSQSRQAISKNLLASERPTAFSSSAVLIPDKTYCLICYSSCTENTDPLGETGSLAQHLVTIFVLRNVLELPLDEVEKYLSCCPSPDQWVGTCHKCTESVKSCQNIYNDLLEISWKFDKAKLELIELIKTSVVVGNKRSLITRWPSITDSTRCFVNNRNYDHLDQPSNPFVEGDQIAEKLATLRKKGKRASIRLHPQSVLKKKTRRTLKAKGTCVNDDANATKPANPNYFANLFYSIKSGQATGKPISPSAPLDEASSSSVPLLPESVNANDDDNNMEEVAVKEEVAEGEDTETEPADDFMDTNDDDMACEAPEKDPPKIGDDGKGKGKIQIRASPRKKIIGKKKDDDKFQEEVDDMEESDSEKEDESEKDNNVMQFTCPVCVQFSCKVTKGELLCQHLETCRVGSGDGSGDMGGENETNETSNVSGDSLTCPVCQQFITSVSENIKFAEHIGVCQGVLCSEEPEVPTSIKVTPLNCRIFQCDLCPRKKFMKLNRFICHYIHHKKMFKFACVKCSSKFTTQQAIRTHWYRFHRPLISKVKKHLRYAKFAMTPSIPWWCPQCSEKFSTEHIRDEHAKSVHSSTSSISPQHELQPHNCPDCENHYLSEDELKLHWSTSHFNENKLNYCEVCFEVFQDRTSLQKHRKKVHRRGIHACTLCEKKYADKQQLKHHFLVHHSNDKTALAKLTCPTCNKVLSTRNTLIQHINSVHKKVIKFFCQVCGYPFRETTSFRRHLANVHKIGNWKQKFFPCSVEGCIHKARSKDKLECHLSWHRKDPQYKCSYCGKDFYFPEKLKRHEQYHTITNPEDMRYQCATCSKKFFRHDLYRQHIRIHDPNRIRNRKPRNENKERNQGKQSKDAKDYKCAICEKVCCGPRLLSRHKREEHPDSMRTCDYCGKVCKSELSRDQHVRIVHEKKFKVKTCEYCGKCFRDVHLSRHYRQMHKDLFT